MSAVITVREVYEAAGVECPVGATKRDALRVIMGEWQWVHTVALQALSDVLHHGSSSPNTLDEMRAEVVEMLELEP